MKNIKQIIKEEINDFDWVSSVETSPNTNGIPQGVVYLRNHAEIKEFIELLSKFNGGWQEWEDKSYMNFHGAFDDLLDRVEGDDFDGHDDWVPVMTTSFFVDKRFPGKLVTGYWTYDVSEDSVEEWFRDDEDGDIIDKTNWKIYTDISQVSTLLSDRLVETDDFGWTSNADDTFTPEMLRHGQKFHDKWGDGRTIMYVGRDDEGICYEPPCTGLDFKIVDDPSGYRVYTNYPQDHELNSGLRINPNDFVEYISSGKYTPIIDDDFKFLDESNDLDWVREVPTFRFYYDEHWFILVDGESETREAEKYIQEEHGYLFNCNEGFLVNDDDYANETALEHDPNVGRIIDTCYIGRYNLTEHLKSEYPNALYYEWSDIKMTLPHSKS